MWFGVTKEFVAVLKKIIIPVHVKVDFMFYVKKINPRHFFLLNIHETLKKKKLIKELKYLSAIKCYFGHKFSFHFNV